MDQAEEKRLIQAAKAGDAQAISSLYQTHVSAIYRYIMSRVNNSHLAEDITADVFVRVLETLPTYEQQNVPFLGWLYRIASGKVIDYYRWSQRRSQEQPLDESLPSTTHSPEQLAIQNIEWETFMQGLQELTEDQQEVILLRFVQGYNLNETAELMGKSTNAIKVLQFRALRSLSKLMGVPLDEPQ